MMHTYEPATGNLLGALALAVSDEIHHDLSARLGATPSAAAALLSLGTRPGLSIRDLSAIIGREHSTTVRIVDRLEADGLAARTPSAADGRQVTVELTAAGRDRFADLQAARHHLLAHRIDALEASERADLHRLLDRLLSSVARDPDHARLVCRLCDHSACRGPACPVGRPFLNP